MGDDIGWMQPSIYHRGLAVGETPNIDRIGNEGATFMTYYAEQSCTAGRTAFITGMQPVRVGMVLPEIPGSPSYLRTGTPHLAKFLLDLGYNTGESADAGSAELSARQRVQNIHRDRRRPGLRPRLFRAVLWHPAGTGGRHRRRHQVQL